MNHEKNYQYDFQVATATAIIFTQVTSNQRAASLIFKHMQDMEKLACKCSTSQFKLTADARHGQCGDCGTITCTTKNTLMEGSSDLIAWIVAIKLMEQGLIVSGHRLARLTGITPSSANMIIRKILMVVSEEMPEEAMLVSAHRFKKIIGRRSVNTQAGNHPYDEQVSLEKQYSKKVESQVAKDISASQEKILALLSEKPISIDSLFSQISASTLMPIGEFNSNLTLLELGDFARQLDDGKFVKLEEERESGLMEVLHGASEETIQNHIDQVTEFTQFIFHSVSRKYLQLFVAAYWCHTDRKRWGKDSLLLACLKHPPITPHEMAAYSSPPLIKLTMPSSTTGEKLQSIK